MTRAKNELSRNEDFMKLYDHLESMFAHTRSSSTNGVSVIQKGLLFLLKFYIISSLSRLIFKLISIDLNMSIYTYLYFLKQ